MSQSILHVIITCTHYYMHFHIYTRVSIFRPNMLFKVYYNILSRITCICTLCLCSCMYLGYVALSFRVCTSVNLLRMRYVLRFRHHYETSLELRAREGEREEQRPLECTIQKKRRNKIRNLWLWFVCCSLLPTCNFHHRPFTHTKHFLVYQLIFQSRGHFHLRRS